MNYLEYLGENAREPRSAATVVATLAFGFNVFWLAAIAPLWTALRLHGLAGLLLIVVGTANAYGVTWFLWRRYVTYPDSLTRKRGAVVGLGLSVVSMATFSMAAYLLIGASSLLTTGAIAPGFESGGIVEYVLWTPVAGALGIILGFLGTFGLQILVCVGSGVLMAHLERRSVVSD